MRKLLQLHLGKVLLLATMVTGLNLWGQGSENFSNIPASASSYASRSWTGTNGVTWTATSARTDQTLNGKAICTNGSGTVTSPTYSGGMGTLQFNYVRGFTGTGARSIDVYVNSVKIGSTITVNASNSTVQSYSGNINVSGNVVLELRTSGNQIIIDDISWTAYTSAPIFAITGTPTAHGPVCQNTAATGVTYTITNTGTSASGITVVSNNSQFVVSNLSSTTIAANGTATYKVTFTPTGTTPQSATITVASTTSGSNSPTSSLTGTTSTTVTQAVTSSAASPVGATTATLNGNVTTLGVCPGSTEKGFVYSLTSANANPQVGGSGVTKTSVGSIATGAYTLGLTNLTPNTDYSFTSYVYDGTTYTYGTVRTFTTTNPTATLSGTLNEGTLNNASFTITLNGETFVDAGSFAGTGFVLNNAPTGVSLASVTRVSNTQATAILSYNDTDFDTSVTTLNIAIPGSHLTAGDPITSGNITITAVAEAFISAGTLALGNQCINTTSGASSFALTGNAKAGNISLAALDGYTYATTTGGTYTPTLSFSHAGGAVSQTIFVKFSPLAVQSYNGNIVISGVGVNTSFNKPVTGAGVNTAPTISAPTSASVTASTAVLGGNATAIGCSAVTERGIYYSTTNGFAIIDGIKVSETGSFGTGVFIINVSSLAPATTYYYKAFATNSGGTVYTAQGTFTTVCLTPVNVTSLATTAPASWQIALTWTNSSCFDEVLVVAKLSGSVTATPSGTGSAYTANAAFGSGTAIATDEYVVYKGSAATVTVTGLTNGSTYYFKVFTRKGSSWSSGVSISDVPVVQYCAASATNIDEYIASVNVNGVTNTSGSSSYTNFTSTIFQVERNLSYPITITLDGNNGGGYVTDKGLLYVDWNKDGDFEDTNESVSLTSGVGVGPYSGTISIPSDAFVGTVRMRIRLFDTSSGETANSCGASTYGEVEDYTLNIGAGTAAPVALSATNTGISGFTARWNEVVGATSYRLDVYQSTGSTATTTEPFNSGFNVPSGWSTTVNGTYTSAGNYGVASPSLQIDNTGDVLETATYPGAATSLSFYVRANGGTNSILLIEGYNGTSWVTVNSYTGFPTTGAIKTYNASSSPALPSGLVKFRFTYTKNSGNIAFDDLTVTYSTTTNTYLTGYQDKTVNATAVNGIISHDVTGAASNTLYRYVVRAVTPVSLNSNEISVTTGKSNTWNGTVWTAGTAPTNIDKAIIEGNYNTSANGTFNASQLVLNSGIFTIASGTNLTVQNEVVNNAGASNFVIENNGNLLQINDVDNTGAVTVAKNSAPLFRLDYAMWSSPVGGETLAGFSPQTLSNRFYRYNPLSDEYATMPGTTTFAEGAGYLIRVANNHPDFVNAETPGTPWQGTFTGTPNNGDVNVAVTPQQSGVSQGYNAVGNPYPSPINIFAFYAANTGTIADGSALYFWRKKNDASTSYYARVTKLAYTANTGNAWGDAGGSAFNGAPNTWVINPGQGFIVQATGSTVHFNNGMRTAVNNGQIFRTAQDESQIAVSRLWLNLSGQDSFSQAAIGYTDMTTLGLDYGWDGKAFVNDGDLTLFSLAGEETLGIQARPSFDVSDIVPMGYQATTAGSYTIAIDHMDGVFETGQDVYLQDNLLNITHDLNQGAYEFTTEAGVTTGRFNILYAQPLSTDNPVLDSNSVIVYKEGNSININSGTADMTGVSVYDTRGRLLYSGKDINATTTVINGLQAEKQVLIINIATTKGDVSKKIIF
ncbi:GEVED domain-containing protein [Flavobacterium sp. DGU11]|uniref:GEVED domain-containing protein n=1 Tax=Flavobacterium arundinis TaxID=3139143 RepID=A0ABU9HUF3_9FLAO